VKGVTSRGKIFNLDITAKTNITAREFVDAFDLFAAFYQTTDASVRIECLNQLCAILYPADADHRQNLVSGQHERMRAVPEATKMLVLFWFSGIVQYYTSHPLYAVLFSSKKKEQGEKFNLGANETALYLMREGYGDPDRMTLNDYFDAQVKALKDTVSHAIAQGAKIEKIAQETGLSLENLNKLK
jgi:DNA-binding Xre family transcriptional regulator